MEPLLEATKIIAKAIKIVYSPTGVMIIQLNGKEAGQTVFHLHFHIIQRSEGLDYKFHSRDVESLEILEIEAKKYFESNVNGTLNILEACRKAKIIKFI